MQTDLAGSPPVDEVLRINLRYLVEVVERFGLCPWARGARESGAVERRVVAGVPSLEPTMAVCDEVAGLETALIGLVVFPDAAAATVADAEAFDRFVESVRQQLARRAGGRPVMAMAAFHPCAAYSTKTAAQLVPLLRRSPDPTIQLVRFSTLDQLKRGPGGGGKFLFDGSAAAFLELERRRHEVPISDRIAADNLATIEKEGAATVQAVLDDIMADRARSYRRSAAR